MSVGTEVDTNRVKYRKRRTVDKVESENNIDRRRKTNPPSIHHKQKKKERQEREESKRHYKTIINDKTKYIEREGCKEEKRMVMGCLDLKKRNKSKKKK